MKKTLLLLGAIAILTSCKKNHSRGGILKGPKVTVYDGKAWTSVKLDEQGNPAQITLTMNNDLLNSVTGNGSSGHHHDDEITLPLPEQVLGRILFQFVMLNWNPSGHPPADIYTKPHFDLHLYLTSPAEAEQYTDPAKLVADPDPAYLPEHHIGADPVPMMGKHWIDATSPELNGVPFTQTFIYGSYGGKVVFYEPMITLEFLKNATRFERTIPQPAKFQKTGYYPTKLLILKHGNVTDIVFDGFVHRQAS